AGKAEVVLARGADGGLAGKLPAAASVTLVARVGDAELPPREVKVERASVAVRAPGGLVEGDRATLEARVAPEDLPADAVPGRRARGLRAGAREVPVELARDGTTWRGAVVVGPGRHELARAEGELAVDLAPFDVARAPVLGARLAGERDVLLEGGKAE